MSGKTLFEETQLGTLRLTNRLIRSATWEGMADKFGHMPKELFSVYARLAQGGVGCIITGFTSVSDNDHLFSGMARLSNDALICEHKHLVTICHNGACPVFAQLALGAYTVPPDVMTQNDIKKATSLFIEAAVRAEKAGYDGVQIHAAHFFFLSQFISPLVNHRTDQYGGSPERRAGILVDILRGIRQRAPSLHITMKINCNDYTPHGLTPKESLAICKFCAEKGLDSVEVSGNGTSVPGIRAGVNEAYFADFALQLADTVDIPVILVGGHRSKEHMEKVLNKGKIQFLSLSRPLIREPNLPRRWQQGDTKPAACISCNQCYQTPGHACIFCR